MQPCTALLLVEQQPRDLASMERIEKTVFLSYRRTNIPWAHAIYLDLTHHGFDVFFDFKGIASGTSSGSFSGI